MQAGRRCHDSPLFGGIDRLVAFRVFGFYGAYLEDVFGQRRFAEFVNQRFEIFVRAIVQEAQRSAARSRVVDDFGHEFVVLTEIQFVADADFTGGIDENVPQQRFAVEFMQQEHRDLCAGLFLFAAEAGGEDARVVHDEDVTLVEIFEDVLESLVFNLLLLPVHDHELAFVAVGARLVGNQFLREIIVKLRKFHNQ